MKLSEWAKQNGLTYKTAWNLFKENKLPVKTIQLESGTILIEEDNKDLIQIKNHINKTVKFFINEFCDKEKSIELLKKFEEEIIK